MARLVVVASFERLRRDNALREELVKRTEDALSALEARVRAGRLADRTKIANAADRILRDSGVARLFEVEVDQGHFMFHYDEAAFLDAVAARYGIAGPIQAQLAPGNQSPLVYS